MWGSTLKHRNSTRQYSSTEHEQRISIPKHTQDTLTDKEQAAGEEGREASQSV